MNWILSLLQAVKRSFGEYVKLYTKDDVILALQTTNYMESILPPKYFIRIHRSNIINIHHTKVIIGNEVLIEQHRLVISKRMRESFMALMKEKGML